MKFETSVKKWGNSLALRINGKMAEAAHLSDGCRVTVETTSEGLIVKPVENKRRRVRLPFTEDELLKGLDPYTAHADELAVLSDKELRH